MYEVGIIGGGAAGLAAALELSQRQITSVVIDSSNDLGGLARDLCCKANPVCQRCDACSPVDIRRAVRKSAFVTLQLNSEVVDVRGAPGNYTLIVESGEEQQEMAVKTVIVAIGSPTFDPQRDARYRYAECPDVLTSRELEVLLTAGKVTVPSTGAVPQSLAVIQCVGSRDAKHGAPYCSKVCCKYSLKLMKRVRKELPTAEVTFFYRDWRPSDRGYDKLAEYGKEPGVQVIRSRPGEVLVDRRPLVRYATVDDEVREDPFDIVVLAVGLQPPRKAEELAAKLGLQCNQHGFFLKQGSGAYPAGCCTGPKDIRESVEEGIAAAGKAAAFLEAHR